MKGLTRHPAKNRKKSPSKRTDGDPNGIEKVLRRDRARKPRTGSEGDWGYGGELQKAGTTSSKEQKTGLPFHWHPYDQHRTLRTEWDMRVKKTHKFSPLPDAEKMCRPRGGLIVEGEQNPRCKRGDRRYLPIMSRNKPGWSFKLWDEKGAEVALKSETNNILFLTSAATGGGQPHRSTRRPWAIKEKAKAQASTGGPEVKPNTKQKKQPQPPATRSCQKGKVPIISRPRRVRLPVGTSREKRRKAKHTRRRPGVTLSQRWRGD